MTTPTSSTRIGRPSGTMVPGDGSGASGASEPATHDLRVDQQTLRLLVHIIDDVLDALELWQSAGDADGRWIIAYWSRRVPPRIGVDLPQPVRTPPDSSNIHCELLAWQAVIIERLLK